VKDDSPPQVWVTPIVGAFAAFFAFDFWISYRNPVFLLISVITWPFICVGLLRTLTTELTDDGTSQMTLRGRKYLAWTDVDKVSRHGRTYWIAGKGQELLLWLALFEDPDAARAFVEGHLPAENQLRSV
jgi:hypothetical protein